MKLLMITPYFYPKIGGRENYAYNFCVGLKKQYKCDIVVITSNHAEKKDKVETIHGIKIYRLAPLFKLSNTPINPFWYWKIKEIIKDEKPDLINAHTPVPGIADIAALAAGNIPFIVTYHAFSIYKHNFTVFNVLVSIYKMFEQLLFNRADKIIIVSDVIKAVIPNKFKNKILVIYNSISSKNISKLKIVNNYKKINIVFISSLDRSHEWKGLNEILLAIKLYVNKTNNNITLNIIGDGNHKQKYQQLVKTYGINKNVKFFGKKESVKKNNILSNATIAIIYPKSSNDAFPTVALEYWANHLPIIASNITPINKLFKNKETAYLIQPNNPNVLAKAIRYISDNKAFAEKISKKGYEELNKKYILENEVKKLYLLIMNFAL